MGSADRLATLLSVQGGSRVGWEALCAPTSGVSVATRGLMIHG
jgi:hypothetical protein